MKKVTTKEKNKEGRPKKMENTNLNQIKKGTIIKSIQDKKHNFNTRDRMDLDN